MTFISLSITDFQNQDLNDASLCVATQKSEMLTFHITVAEALKKLPEVEKLLQRKADIETTDVGITYYRLYGYVPEGE